MKQNAVIEHLKQKKTMTPAEREENQRLAVCICVCVEWQKNDKLECAFSLEFVTVCVKIYEYHFVGVQRCLFDGQEVYFQLFWVMRRIKLDTFFPQIRLKALRQHIFEAI